MSIKENWHLEYFHHHQYVQGFGPSKSLYKKASPYQLIEVIETPITGKMLLLDGKTMVSEADEFVYHELMAHVPMMCQEKAKRVLIIGGGDGGIVRELVKYPQLEHIHLIEIDQEVISVSEEFFPQCTSGLKDPRVSVIVQDGHLYLKENKEHYDIIIIDSTDPENFASSLFTEEFYGLVKKHLAPTGIMMAQSENPFLDCYDLTSIYNQMRKNFNIVKSLSAPMLIYPGVYWSFAFCSEEILPSNLVEKQVDFLKKNLLADLKWYNPEWHLGAFMISNYHKKKIGEK